MKGLKKIGKIFVYGLICVLAGYILYKASEVLKSTIGLEVGKSGKNQLLEAAILVHAPALLSSEEDSSFTEDASADLATALTEGTGETQLDFAQETEVSGITEMPETTEVTELSETMQVTEETEISETLQTAETETAIETTTETTETAQAGQEVWNVTDRILDYNTFVNRYFIVDAQTSVDEEMLDQEKLLSEDLHLENKEGVPQILIYHTHSQEAFVDSAEGEVSDTVVGMGEVLKAALESYGYTVIHDTSEYDIAGGSLDRSKAYDYAREGITALLEEYPEIEVIIDLHRDGVDGVHLATEIDGKPVAQLMFFNGVSRNSDSQSLEALPNPYIEDNLAFSLQLQKAAEEAYPGLMRNIYINKYRYNLHLRPRSLLVEAGTQLNTVEEERNACGYLADILYQVLSGS